MEVLFASPTSLAGSGGLSMERRWSVCVGGSFSGGRHAKDCIVCGI